MFTWKPMGWKLEQRRLTAEERSLLHGTLARINRVLGLCECGKTPEPVGNRDRCAECWGKR